LLKERRCHYARAYQRQLLFSCSQESKRNPTFRAQGRDSTLLHLINDAVPLPKMIATLST
jgi:hypothetical protein